MHASIMNIFFLIFNIIYNRKKLCIKTEEELTSRFHANTTDNYVENAFSME